MGRTTFINKYADSGNVAQSTHEERKLINERNREYREPRRAQRKAKNIFKLHGGDSTDLRPNNGPRSTTAWKKQTSYDSKIFQSIENVDLSEPPPNNRICLEPPHPQSAVVNVCPRLGSPIDPFDTSSVPPTATVLQLLRYYKEVYYTSLWTRIWYAFDGDLDTWGIVRCPPEQIILECMHNRARIYTLLADLGCQLKYTEGLNPRVNTYHLIQRAMQSFREEFETSPKVDGGMLCDALHLYLAESAINQEEAAKAHLAGLRAIVQRIIDQGDRIIKPQAALVALVDVGLSKQLLSDPAKVRERTPEFLGELDMGHLKSRVYSTD
ncbi:hypothetical protein H2198_000423 [Neophaeococcomyces mojaviensis]|uniref:Uncharacterized protein n=1 Tax=Neophaeococcomyces mojaviensis TaxID=3383035 RepID=A0ACC3AJY7_9EURO|nr:hypothetical protein H2198_000423 [Knufia sp. JES_112]